MFNQALPRPAVRVPASLLDVRLQIAAGSLGAARGALATSPVPRDGDWRRCSGGSPPAGRCVAVRPWSCVPCWEFFEAFHGVKRDTTTTLWNLKNCRTPPSQLPVVRASLSGSHRYDLQTHFQQTAWIALESARHSLGAIQVFVDCFVVGIHGLNPHFTSASNLRRSGLSIRRENSRRSATRNVQAAFAFRISRVMKNSSEKHSSGDFIQ